MAYNITFTNSEYMKKIKKNKNIIKRINNRTYHKFLWVKFIQ